MKTQLKSSMMPVMIIVWLILLTTLASAQSGTVLPVPEVFQEQGNWGWAACSQAIINYYGDLSVQQCDIANWARLGNGWGDGDCCDPIDAADTTICDQLNDLYGSAGSIQGILTGWQLNTDVWYGFVLWPNEIKERIDDQRPFVMRWAWTVGEGQFMVGRGWDSISDIVHYMDPWTGYQSDSYDYVRSSPDHEWTHTLDIRTDPIPGDYVIFLIDRSGSMGEGTSIAGLPSWTKRLDYAKVLAAEDAAFVFSPASGMVNPKAAVMFFSGSIPGHVVMKGAGFTEDLADITGDIATINGPDGATPLAKAMCYAADILAAKSDPASLHLYVYTDGGENAIYDLFPQPQVCAPCLAYPFEWNTICKPYDCTPLNSGTCTDFQCVLANQLAINQINNVRYFGSGVINKNTSGPDYDFLMWISQNSGGWFEFMNDVFTPTVKIEKTHGTLQGHYTEVSITTELSDLEMGGFNFLIAYDASALTFTEATPGQLLEDCGWEYFTYRYGVEGNCGDACPSGLLRIIAMAETLNGPFHPFCYGPPDNEPYELASLKFLVTNDRTFDCQYVPIRFFWDDCRDNAISSIDGEILYIDRAIYDFEENLIWDEEDDDQFPEDARIPFVGTPDYCLNPDPEKPSAMRIINFVNGGIDIICSDSIDARGDINVNGVVNEIADAVIFTNYFISGISAFGDHAEASTAASDVNADGTALSVADLVYLVRIITGDAPPYPKVVPYAKEASVSTMINHSAAAVSTNSSTDIGAGYFVFNHSGLEVGEPQLINGASDMTLKYSNDNGVLKVLVYSMEKGVMIPAGTENIFAVPIAGIGTIELTETELSDYYGNLLEVSIDKQTALPDKYALHQNYPNPFNAATTIIYELPVATDLTIEIFNVLGQKIMTLFDGPESAGVHSISWDGADKSGTTVSSGVYFYRISSPVFTTEKKMVLMK